MRTIRSRAGGTGKGGNPLAEVRLEGVHKTYPGGVRAVRDATLTIQDREFVVLVGPSGCGKSTLLRMVAGLETVTSGNIFIGGRVVNDLEPRQRDVAMVFQSYALYPHMNVFDNMALALKLRKVPRDDIASRVRDAARILGIEELLDRKPRQLSGGQRQRVAVGRAIVRNPQVFLFDEPLSNLDAKKRVQTRAELTQLHRRLQATILYVTHDQVEAMTMGDRIVVLQDGGIQQIGAPLEVYRQPANRFVAEFIGSPPMNLLRVGHDDGGALQSDGGTRIDVPSATCLPADAEFDFGVRPEHLYAGERPQQLSQAASFDAQVSFVELLGNEMQLHFDLPGGATWIATVRGGQPPAPGTPTRVWIDLQQAHYFSARTGQPLAATSA